MAVLSSLRTMFILCGLVYFLGFPGGSEVKNSPAVQEMWVRSLGQEDALEEEMAVHSSIFAWGIPWTEEPGGLQSVGSQRVGHDLRTKPPPPLEVVEANYKQLPNRQEL